MRCNCIFCQQDVGRGIRRRNPGPGRAHPGQNKLELLERAANWLRAWGYDLVTIVWEWQSRSHDIEAYKDGKLYRFYVFRSRRVTGNNWLSEIAGKDICEIHTWPRVQAIFWVPRKGFFAITHKEFKKQCGKATFNLSQAVNLSGGQFPREGYYPRRNPFWDKAKKVVKTSMRLGGKLVPFMNVPPVVIRNFGSIALDYVVPRPARKEFLRTLDSYLKLGRQGCLDHLGQEECQKIENTAISLGKKWANKSREVEEWMGRDGQFDAYIDLFNKELEQSLRKNPIGADVPLQEGGEPFKPVNRNKALRSIQLAVKYDLHPHDIEQMEMWFDLGDKVLNEGFVPPGLESLQDHPGMEELFSRMYFQKVISALVTAFRKKYESYAGGVVITRGIPMEFTEFIRDVDLDKLSRDGS